MTTIAYDGKTFAADTAVWRGDTYWRETKKIETLPDGTLIAIAGVAHTYLGQELERMGFKVEDDNNV